MLTWFVLLKLWLFYSIACQNWRNGKNVFFTGGIESNACKKNLRHLFTMKYSTFYLINNNLIKLKVTRKYNYCPYKIRESRITNFVFIKQHISNFIKENINCYREMSSLKSLTQNGGQTKNVRF